MRNIKSEIVKWSDETEKLSEKWADEKGRSEVPDKEFINGGFGERAFFPSDFRMENIGENGGDESGDEGREPE